MPESGKKPDTGYLRAFALIGQVGLIMVAAIVFGVTVGIYIDRKVNGGGLVLVMSILFGVAAGAYLAYRILAKEIP